MDLETMHVDRYFRDPEGEPTTVAFVCFNADVVTSAAVSIGRASNYDGIHVTLHFE